MSGHAGDIIGVNSVKTAVSGHSYTLLIIFSPFLHLDPVGFRGNKYVCVDKLRIWGLHGEKQCLKYWFNLLQKTKIMASGPTTSWQIDGK